MKHEWLRHLVGVMLGMVAIYLLGAWIAVRLS